MLCRFLGPNSVFPCVGWVCLPVTAVQFDSNPNLVRHTGHWEQRAMGTWCWPGIDGHVAVYPKSYATAEPCTIWSCCSWDNYQWGFRLFHISFMALSMPGVFPLSCRPWLVCQLSLCSFQGANVCLWFVNFTLWSMKAAGLPQTEMVSLFWVFGTSRSDF